ncbi:MAG: hypothetical protein IJ326_07445 [Lachnospiraceae bacterium]|nr:hypothetical protein [Lachnospiraceae bacterium]
MGKGIVYDQLTRMIDTVPVWDMQGNKLHEIKLPEKIMPISSKRVGLAESGLYYKGAGSIYQCHFVNESEKELKLLSKTGIIYEQYKVCYPKLVGRHGIFDFPHQAVFSDMEGGCGRKEKNLLKMQKKFELSAIEEIVNVIPIGINEHNIYVYRLKNIKSELSDVIKLIEYILSNNFNTAWDKNLWNDIYGYQYVRDVADWFISDKLCHKLGTVYALLHSLYNDDIYQYTMLLKLVLGVHNCDKHFILYYSALIVYKYNPSLFSGMDNDVEEVTPQLYAELLRLLFSGKACCHLENEKKWEWVRAHYITRISRYVKVFERRLLSYLF